MKLPYIKVEVEYREEETGAPGKVSPALIVGFGLHWAWVYLFIFNGQYILFPEADSMQLLLSATSGVFHAVALLLYAVFLKQARQLFDTPAPTSAATVRSRRFWWPARRFCAWRGTWSR